MHCNSIQFQCVNCTSESNSHPFSSIQTIPNHINFVQQCIQISTRINSSSEHTYICFIRNYQIFNTSHDLSRNDLIEQIKPYLFRENSMNCFGQFNHLNKQKKLGRMVAQRMVPFTYHQMLHNRLSPVLCCPGQPVHLAH